MPEIRLVRHRAKHGPQVSGLGRDLAQAAEDPPTHPPGVAVQEAMSTLLTAHHDLCGLLQELRLDLVGSEQWDTHSRNTLVEATRVWDQSIIRQRDLILTMPVLLRPSTFGAGAAPQNLLP